MQVAGHASPARRWITFAGVVLLLRALLNVVSGTEALARDSAARWGALWLGLALVQAVVGLGVLERWRWGNRAGVAVAVLSAVTWLAFMRAAPVWAPVAVALDMLVMYGFTLHWSVEASVRS